MKLIINFLVNLFIKLIFRIKVWGSENILSGPLILCINHSSNFDPLVLRTEIKREINFLAKKELFNNKILGFLLKKFGVIPVDRNKNDLTAYKQVIKNLRNGKLIGIFIEGTRKQNHDLAQAKNGAAMFAIKTSSPIIPVAIKSNFKLFSVVEINIGKPIYFDLDKKKIDHEILNNATLEITNQIKLLLED